MGSGTSSSVSKMDCLAASTRKTAGAITSTATTTNTASATSVRMRSASEIVVACVEERASASSMDAFMASRIVLNPFCITKKTSGLSMVISVTL
jgi:hypothetical protein